LPFALKHSSKLLIIDILLYLFQYYIKSLTHKFDTRIVAKL